MPYSVVQAGELSVPPYLRAGDSQTLGTGQAQTSFLSLPGGGFYDNYQDKVSPQGIRPISASRLLLGTAAELRAQVQAWRGQLGRRVRLTVEWDDGELMWQWARLQNVDTPRGIENKGGWCPLALTWISAAQNWRGIERDLTGWTWGDGTWRFGDGSAGFGISGPSFAVTAADQTFTVTQDGSIDAPNVTLRFAINGTWQNLTVINKTTGQQIYIVRSAADSTPFVEIDTGAHSIYSGGALVNIGSIYRLQNQIKVTAIGNGLTTGDTVRIQDTGIYDGDYYPVSTETSSAFHVTVPANFSGYGTLGFGSMRRLDDLYGVTTFTDPARWMVLAPGDNAIQVIWSTMPTGATLFVGYNDQYA